MIKRIAIALACIFAFGTLSACESAPRREFVEWVARDAWDSGCAQAAAVERFVINDKGWKEKGKLYRVNVDATFKLLNACKTGKSKPEYGQAESVPFKSDVFMKPCTAEGKKGWTVAGGQAGRCWTGPTPPAM